MKKKTDELLARVLDWLNRDNGWNWYEDSLCRSEWPRFDVCPSGKVSVSGLGELPFDWTQRRSVARAYKRVHRAMTLKLVEAGKAAQKAGGAR